HTPRRSIGETFYSPEESIGDENEIGDLQQKSWHPSVQHEIDQVKSSTNKQDQTISNFPNQQQKQKNKRK
ncbi:unnamed protein product, partial [Rotaria sordida]